MNSLTNAIKNLPKKMFVIAVSLLVAVLATTGVLTAANEVTMEGHVKSLNVTTGETEYSESTDLLVDDVAQIQLWHHSRENPAGPKADNTVVRFEVSQNEGTTQTVRGISSSDNGDTIDDTTTINLSTEKAQLQYVPGSAKFRYNKGAADGVESCMTGFDYPAESCYATVSLPDSIMTTGVNLDEIRGGPLTGCNAYHETVIVQVRSYADAVSVNKYVRHVGEGASDWSTSTTAEPGDDLEYLIRFENEGNTILNNVMVGDNLPKYHTYVEDTTNLQNGNHPDGIAISNNNITRGGINVGNYSPGSVGYVWFTSRLDTIEAYERCGEYELANVGVVRPE
jgi:uncharacterized repeat protein (TIGR01451 family)